MSKLQTLENITYVLKRLVTPAADKSNDALTGNTSHNSTHYLGYGLVAVGAVSAVCLSTSIGYSLIKLLIDQRNENKQQAEKHAQEIVDQRKEHAQEIQKKDVEHNLELKKKEDEHNEEIKKKADEHNKEIKTKADEHNKEIKTKADMHNKEIKAIADEHNKEIKIKEEEHNKEIQKQEQNLRTSHRHQKESLQAKHHLVLRNDFGSLLSAVGFAIGGANFVTRGGLYLPIIAPQEDTTKNETELVQKLPTSKVLRDKQRQTR